MSNICNANLVALCNVGNSCISLSLFPACVFVVWEWFNVSYIQSASSRGIGAAGCVVYRLMARPELLWLLARAYFSSPLKMPSLMSHVATMECLSECWKCEMYTVWFVVPRLCACDLIIRRGLSGSGVSSHTCVCSNGFRERCARLVKVLLPVKQLEERWPALFLLLFSPQIVVHVKGTPKTKSNFALQSSH